MKNLKVNTPYAALAKNWYVNNILNGPFVRGFSTFFIPGKPETKKDNSIKNQDKREEILSRIAPKPNFSLLNTISVSTIVISSSLYINKLWELNLTASSYCYLMMGFGFYKKVLKFYRESFAVENCLKILNNIRELSDDIDEIRRIKQGQNKKEFTEIFEKKEPFIEEYETGKTVTTGEKKILGLIVEGLDPRLAELWLLKSQIKSNSIGTVKVLLGENIITELEGETSALNYALETCPKNSEMVKLLNEHEKKTESFKQAHRLSKSCPNVEKPAKPPTSFYSRRLVYCRKNQRKYSYSR